MNIRVKRFKEKIKWISRYFKSIEPVKPTVDYNPALSHLRQLKFDGKRGIAQVEAEIAFLRWLELVYKQSQGDIVNNKMLLIIGDGGIGKNTFIESLIPYDLYRNYSECAIERGEKDFEMKMASHFLINVDELVSPKNELISMLHDRLHNIRLPYERAPQLYVRNASFASTLLASHYWKKKTYWGNPHFIHLPVKDASDRQERIANIYNVDIDKVWGVAKFLAHNEDFNIGKLINEDYK